MFGLDVGGDKGGGGAERKSLGDSDGSGSGSACRAAAAQDNATIATLVMTAHNFIDLKIMADPMITLQLSAGMDRAQTQRYVASGDGPCGWTANHRADDRQAWRARPHDIHARCYDRIGPPSWFAPVEFHDARTWGAWRLGGVPATHCVKQLSRICAWPPDGLERKLSGLQANLRALCVSIGPFAYATLASWGFKNKRPGLAFSSVCKFLCRRGVASPEAAGWARAQVAVGCRGQAQHPNTPARS